jgi:CheY-like chemotaxis protein
MNARILIIEDEPDIVRGLELNLKAEGYDVLAAETGPAGLDTTLREMPDLVLLDIMLPGMSGLDVCRELRKRNFDRPVIMLTARSAEVDRVVGLEIGADDYVTKPFGIRELLARIRVRLRRHAGIRPQDAALRFGEVEIDFEKHEAVRRGARRADGQGVRRHPSARGQPREDRDPRPAARRGMGLRTLSNDTDRRQSHPAPAPDAGGDSVGPAVHPLDLRRGVQVRGLTIHDKG